MMASKRKSQSSSSPSVHDASAKSAKVACPICARSYPAFLVASHASTCSAFAPDDHDDAANCSGPTVSGVVRQPTQDVPSPSTSKSKPDYGKVEPWAERVRPVSMDDYVGQNDAVGRSSVIGRIIAAGDVPNIILWGPPGCGKTTLARIIAESCKSDESKRFVQLSAASSSVAEVRAVVDRAKTEATKSVVRRRTILFMDEIHRFNKLQQDCFLGCVESGVITLIGATTENPSFSLNSALLSRCKVVVLQKLSIDEVVVILKKAVKKLGFKLVGDASVHEDSSSSQVSPESQNGSSGEAVIVEEPVLRSLAELSDGDARMSINALQMAVQSVYADGGAKHILSKKHVLEGFKRTHLLYDRKGEEHYNAASALQKSIRGSDPNAALYWVARMLTGGEDPLFVARRLIVTASEDVGSADPHAILKAVAAQQAVQAIGMPECGVVLAETAVYLARAPKSRSVHDALSRAKDSIENWNGPLPPVPLHLRNASTKLMKDLGYGKGYSMNRAEMKLSFMPEGMEDVDFFSGSS